MCRFPGVKNSMLKDTLIAVAERVGRSNSDKKWVIKDEANSEEANVL